MRFVRKNFMALLALFVSTLSLILVIFLPGIYGKTVEEQYYVGTLDFVFGNSKMLVKTKDFSTWIDLNGGTSLLGVASIGFLALSMIFAILSFYLKNFPYDYYGTVFMIISGVCMLLLFNSGTTVSFLKDVFEYRAFISLFGFRLGAGAITYGVTTIVGGIIGIFIEEKNLIR